MKGKKSEEVSLRGFLRHMYEHWRVSYEAITDSKRTVPVISKNTIANVLICATVQGARSLREADFLSHSPVMRSVTGRGVSDSSLARAAGGFRGTRRLLRSFWRRLRSRGLFGGEHIAVVDGTFWGGHFTSVVAQIGAVPAVIDTANIGHQGKELCTSLALLDRLGQQEGHFADYVLGDDLYACERFWQVCERLSAYGLVKSCDTQAYHAITQAKELFDYPVRGEQLGYQYAEGTDLEKACHYRIWQTTALWADTRRRITVARVEETGLKTAGHEVFWVLTQDLAIDPLKLRRLAHARWFIENNVFKAFNDTAHSKHQFSRDAHTAEVLTHLQALAFMMLSVYRHDLEQDPETPRRLWDHGRIALRLLQSVLRFVFSLADSS